MTEPRRAVSQYRLDVLDHLIHEDWCDWKTTKECSCDAGQMLIALIAKERGEAAQAAPLDVERLAACLYNRDERLRYSRGGERPFLNLWADLSAARQGLYRQEAQAIRAEYARLAQPTPAEGEE